MTPSPISGSAGAQPTTTTGWESQARQTPLRSREGDTISSSRAEESSIFEKITSFFLAIFKAIFSCCNGIIPRQDIYIKGFTFFNDSEEPKLKLCTFFEDIHGQDDDLKPSFNALADVICAHAKDETQIRMTFDDRSTLELSTDCESLLDELGEQDRKRIQKHFTLTQLSSDGQVTLTFKRK